MNTGIVSLPEFICKTPQNSRAGGFITSRDYCQSTSRGMSARRLPDAAVLEHLRHVHAANYGLYGARKMWHALCREGIAIGCEQNARLMRMAGLSDKGGHLSLPADPRGAVLCPDLVGRRFTATGPNRGWVADITYVRTRKGFVYTAFIADL